MTDPVTVARLDDLAPGTMKLVRADGRRLCLVRTREGVFALDHACPHEGYGLTQGELDEEGVVTCAWHNWKFRVSDGACVLGEEAVTTHPIHVDADGGVSVLVRRPDPAAARPRLLASLRSGIEHNYTGQISRDVVRLLQASSDPGELVWQAIAYGAPRAEFGWGHSVASATDCLSMIDQYEDEQRALPIVQPSPGSPRRSGAGWCGRSRPPRPTSVRTRRRRSARWSRPSGSSPRRPSCSAPWEDKLPYMRRFLRALGDVDLDALSLVEPADGWEDDGRLLDALLGADREAPVGAAVAALTAGSGVDRLLDVVVAAVSERMLRYDTTGERDLHDDFGWLDITHGLTYANAARWHDSQHPGNDSLRLALWTVFQAHWTGRHEWHSTVGPRADLESGPADLSAYGRSLQQTSLLDATSAFIVHAHAVKTSVAATAEALRSGSSLPLDATARFLDAPKLERFVAATVTRSIDFLTGRAPRDE